MLMYLALIDAPADRSKFEQLYHQYVKLMHHVAFYMLGDESDAWDAVQEAFFALAKNIEKISEPVCPKTKHLCVLVVERKAIDMLRKRTRRAEEVLDDNLPGYPIEYEGENALTHCILQLPARYREIILLKYEQGYSTREAARIMGLTEANAQSLDQRAKRKLEMLCREEGLL